MDRGVHVQTAKVNLIAGWSIYLWAVQYIQLFVLQFYGPADPLGSCTMQSV